jgi:hypothetical protein
VADKPKKPVKDISDLKAKLGLAKPGAKKPGGAVPPPAGVVPPPGASGAPAQSVPPPGGGGQQAPASVPPPGGVVPPGGVGQGRGEVVPPSGYQQPQPAQPAQPAAAAVGGAIAADEGLGEEGVHGKKDLVFRIILGVLAVIAFFIGTQCGKTILIRGWVNKVTDDSKKITAKLKVLNRAVRKLEALEKQVPMVDKRGNFIETYSDEFGRKAETLVADMEKLKEAEVFGIFYNMLKPEHQQVVGQLFLYFALLKRLRHFVIAMRKFEGTERQALQLITPEGQKKLKEQRQKTKFGAYYTGEKSVALTILDAKNARCGPKLKQKCGSKAPKGYVIEVGGMEKTVAFDAEKKEEQLLNLNLGGMGGLAQCFGADTAVQQNLARAKAVWRMYVMYRVQIHKILQKIQQKAKPTNILKVYEKYARRGKINKYVIF